MRQLLILLNHNKMDTLEKMLKDKSINRNGILLFSKKNSIEFIKKCRDLNISILGIDGFFLTDTTIEPSMMNSIDLSKHKQCNSHELALNFFNDKSDNLFFEIVY